jgi:hypothetical protein
MTWIIQIVKLSKHFQEAISLDQAQFKQCRDTFIFQKNKIDCNVCGHNIGNSHLCYNYTWMHKWRQPLLSN